MTSGGAALINQLVRRVVFLPPGFAERSRGSSRRPPPGAAGSLTAPSGRSRRARPDGATRNRLVFAFNDGRGEKREGGRGRKEEKKIKADQASSCAGRRGRRGRRCRASPINCLLAKCIFAHYLVLSLDCVRLIPYHNWSCTPPLGQSRLTAN